VEWLELKALSSSPIIAKKKEKEKERPEKKAAFVFTNITKVY
jgi:hypothetical protein